MGSVARVSRQREGGQRQGEGLLLVGQAHAQRQARLHQGRDHRVLLSGGGCAAVRKRTQSATYVTANP